ncbi:hypothetical protein WJX74_006099 [Apatococcus lobatus]|uniref:YbaK/aminoacyl-tRNA synthetase-associated domain-containing protein n=1 Tax=Apatococcus lobatus TaxID=904363 RepID=A0AAW1QUE7_9CHLO
MQRLDLVRERQELILQRLSELIQRVLQAEASQAEPAAISAEASDVPHAEASELQHRLRCELKSRGVTSFRFKRVPSDYYDRPLEGRQQMLAASSIEQLCKSIVLENVLHEPNPLTCTAACHSKHFLVLVQYAAKLHTEKLKRCLVKLSEGTLRAKHVNLRLAPEATSGQLTGFGHNAVTPVGMRTPLPIIMSHHIQNLQPGWFWMGGGEVDLKLGLPTAAFISAYQPLVLDFLGSRMGRKDDLPLCLACRRFL